jgi:hypothetical protein
VEEGKFMHKRYIAEQIERIYTPCVEASTWQQVFQALGDSPSLIQLELAARQLVLECLVDPWGEISPSIYDTAMAVKWLPPSLRPTGAIAYLLRHQQPDGSWGRHPGVSYRLVPTVAATCALLHLLLETIPEESKLTGAETYAQAARQGLSFLMIALQEYCVLPDTVAIELILPALCQEIFELVQALHTMGRAISPSLDDLHARLLTQFSPLARKSLGQMRARVRQKGMLSAQMSHCLEILGDDLSEIAYLFIPQSQGILGGSPAATAAMIAKTPLKMSRSIPQLAAVAARFAGALPVAYPINIMERSWVLFFLLQVGMVLPEDVPGFMISYLQGCLGPQGTSYAESLLPDADDTGVVLAVLSDLGAPGNLSCLWPYEAEKYFYCMSGERNPSVTTNAHVLDALSRHLQKGQSLGGRIEQAAHKCIGYLLTEQRPDGSWLDKWHASPYYATTCCVGALRYFETYDVQQTLQRACTWILQTQREDGSWGQWGCTLEETACALIALILAHPDQRVYRRCVQRGRAFLLTHLLASSEAPERAPLWHGKELYEPTRVVQAVVLAALYLSGQVYL